MTSFAAMIDRAADVAGPAGFESIAGMVRGRLPSLVGECCPRVEFTRPGRVKHGGTWILDGGRTSVEAILRGPGQSTTAPAFVAFKATRDGNQFVLGKSRSLGHALLLAIQAAVSARLADEWEGPA